MEEKKENGKSVNDKEYQPPKGAKARLEAVVAGTKLKYEAEADWIILRKNEKPSAEMFFVRYFQNDEEKRPITFVFNGGPGASSVYLHFGAMGPRRVDFKDNGDVLPPPYKLVDNNETWLQFTDLVFIDPIGTGFSRMIQDDKEDEKKDGKKDVEYWRLKRDLESLCEFIRKFLSRYHRWESPVYIAGESYGGFRVARLASLLQKDYGVGLSGAILISPALEFTLLDSSDYDTLMWVDTFPVMAGAAFYHGKARKNKPGEDRQAYAKRAGEFALVELLPVLAAGDLLGADKKVKVLNTAADFIGISREDMRIKNGRVGIDWFVKNLLRDKQLQLGLYDASVTVADPYPDRDVWVGPDPTLHMLERVFASGINSQVRQAIGLETERDYDLLSMEVNKNWKIDTREHALRSQVGATDDLRFGMSLNPDMKVFITHGVFDLVTPFFATDRIANLMKLDDIRRKKLTVKHYEGGHMFYTWIDSRRAFYNDMYDFYENM